LDLIPSELGLDKCFCGICSASVRASEQRFGICETQKKFVIVSVGSEYDYSYFFIVNLNKLYQKTPKAF